MKERISGTRPLLRRAAVLVAACLVFAAVFCMTASEVQAAETFAITRLKWVKGTVDTTLKTESNPMNVKLKVGAINTVGQSNRIAVTIQNTKSKTKLTAYVGKTGGTATFELYNTKKHTGKWKIVSVSAVRLRTKVVGRVPGSWVNGKWQSGFNVVSNTYKKLKTINTSEPSLTVKCGAQTQLTLAAPSSVYASVTTVPLTATLKNDKGKPVAGQTVRFQLVPGRASKSTVTREDPAILVSAVTDSKGVATVNAKVPQSAYSETEYRGFTTTAYYQGKAKKYCASESTARETTQPKEKTAFVLAPTWDGHTGARSFSVQLAIAEGERKGTPVAGVPVEWQFKTATNGELYHKVAENTNAEGFSTTAWSISKWDDYDVLVNTQLSSMKSMPYAPPTPETFRIAKKQDTVGYTVNTSKFQLLGGLSADVNWFAGSGASKAFGTLAGAEGVLVNAAGAPLPHVGTITPSKMTCTIQDASAGSAYLVQNKQIDFSLNARNVIPVTTASRFTVDAPARAATRVQVTLTLPTFTGLYNAEYVYVPLAQSVSFYLGS